MHPSIMRYTVGYQDHIDRGPTLDFLPKSAYEYDRPTRVADPVMIIKKPQPAPAENREATQTDSEPHEEAIAPLRPSRLFDMVKKIWQTEKELETA